MNRIFKCKINIKNVPIQVIEQELSIDSKYTANLIFECFYQVEDEQAFKQRTTYDITNAIHRNKIEEQLKIFISNIIYNSFQNEKIGKMKYRQIKECDVDIQDEINSHVKKFYLLKEGLDILEIEMIEIKLSYPDKKEIEDKIKLQKTINEIKDIDTELKLRLPEFVDIKAEEKTKPWTCSCGSYNRTNFCPECGARKEDEENKIILSL